RPGCGGPATKPSRTAPPWVRGPAAAPTPATTSGGSRAQPPDDQQEAGQSDHQPRVPAVRAVGIDDLGIGVELDSLLRVDTLHDPLHGSRVVRLVELAAVLGDDLLVLAAGLFGGSVLRRGVQAVDLDVAL